ncbi:MAG: hypothetical protein V1798_08920 [Pseudomonadota bacterium]
MARSGFRLYALLLTAILLSFACGHRTRFFGASSGGRYHDVLNRCTQERRFFGLENVEYATFVTYRTPELRRAYVEEYADRYRLSTAEAEALLKSELDEATRYDVFLVSHYSTDPKARRLKPESNVWRLILSTSPDPGTGMEPALVQGEPSGRDPVLGYFYPFVTPWASNYLVKFKRQEGTPSLYLDMTGVLAELRFTFQRGAEVTDGTGRLH